MADEQLTFTLGAEDKASAAIKKVTDSLDKMAKIAEDSGNRTNRVFDTIAGVVGGNLVTGALRKLGSAANDVFDIFITQGIKAASESEKGLTDLGNALNRAGADAESATKAFDDFAKNLQNITVFEDDAIIKTGALISTLSGLSGQSLEKATQAALDLSAAIGIDLDSAAKAIAKSANGSTEALAKFGVQIKKNADGTVDFDAVLAKLNARFGGAAAGQVQNFGGSLARLGNIFNSFQESVGQIITKNPAVIAGINALGTGIAKLANVFQENRQEVTRFLGVLVSGIANGIPIVIEVLSSLDTAISNTLGFFDFLAVGAAKAIAKIKGASDETIQAIEENGQREELERQNNLKSRQEFAKQAADFARGLAKEVEIASQKQVDFDKVIITSTKGTASAIEETGVKLKTFIDLLTELGTSTGNSLGGLQAPFQQALADIAIAQDTFFLQQNEKFYVNNEEQIAAFSAFQEQRLQIIIAQYNQEQLALDTALEQKKISEQQYAQSSAILEAKRVEESKKSTNAILKFEQQKQQERAANLRGSFSYISSLQQESNSTLFAVGKAAALATAYIDGQAAVQKALTAAPPPYNFVLAGLVGVAAAANVARIASAQPPKFARGITEVPAGFGGDSFAAQLSSGERVVPASSNEDLKAFLAESMGSKEILIQIANRLDRLESHTTVNIGGREIISEIRSSLSEGRSLQAI